MSDLLSHHPVTDLVPEGHYGPDAAQPGLTAQVVDGLALATVAARKGASGALAQAVLDAFGIALVDAPKVSFLGDLSFIGTAPGRWLATAGGAPAAHVARLQGALADAAALTDQSDGSLIIDVYGPKARMALAKLVPLDLHPAVFAPGDAAATAAALIPLVVWQLNDMPAYRFAVPRSFAPAFLRALVSGAAEFGVTVSGTARG
ncbi:sarcosine oxidase subunit gamma [Aquabacter spiritensis]|uniref:N-methylglutamate dehydrogenase subunit D n=1 Tax=Aquabacter spiritensis TaxID=933073 RepID=A0A4R3LSM4_9HYPH|nr:sarcosine oxidase subunit gamma family protein [Aquabacter spiritensis]TCT03532.1 N-methylglutamate dehydrogenase subunit D [Aquabacter spiritensis]